MRGKEKKITPWIQIWVNDGKWYTQIIRVNFNEAKKLNDSGNRENSKFTSYFIVSLYGKAQLNETYISYS